LGERWRGRGAELRKWYSDLLTSLLGSGAEYAPEGRERYGLYEQKILARFLV
jgi:hypothetical protein